LRKEWEVLGLPDVVVIYGNKHDHAKKIAQEIRELCFERDNHRVHPARNILPVKADRQEP
jgi:hypothetical protein